MLGNRCRVGTVGGAPVPDSVFRFVREVLGIDLVSMYGSRECGGIACDNVVYPGVTVRLRSVPAMEYLTTDTPSRGEVYVSSPRLIAAYHGDAERTRASFVSDFGDGKRYFRTGDVGEMWEEGGQTMVRVLDRCGACFKLQQGDWVSPAYVENVLEQSALIQQALVLGPSRAKAASWSCAARTLNAIGQCQVTLSRRQEHLRAGCQARQEERELTSLPNTISCALGLPPSSFLY